MKSKLRRFSKSAVSLLLSVVMVVSMMTVGIVAVSAWSFQNTAIIYFDATNWADYSSKSVYFALLFNGNSEREIFKMNRISSNTSSKIYYYEMNNYTGTNNAGGSNIVFFSGDSGWDNGYESGSNKGLGDIQYWSVQQGGTYSNTYGTNIYNNHIYYFSVGGSSANSGLTLSNDYGAISDANKINGYTARNTDSIWSYDVSATCSVATSIGGTYSTNNASSTQGGKVAVSASYFDGWDHTSGAGESTSSYTTSTYGKAAKSTSFTLKVKEVFAGYQFDGWATSATGTVVNANTSYSPGTVTKKTTYYAKFTKIGDAAVVYAKDGMVRTPSNGDTNTYEWFTDHADSTISGDISGSVSNGTEYQSATVLAGKTITVTTTIAAGYADDFYVVGWDVNGETYGYSTAGKSETTTSSKAYSFTYTVPTDITSGSVVSITPVYYYTDAYKTAKGITTKEFIVKEFDSTIQTKWGKTLYCYPFYDGLSNMSNSFGGYPGQPMLNVGGDLKTEVPLTFSSKNIQGITVSNGYYDDVNRTVYGWGYEDKNLHYQTYDSRDFQAIAALPNVRKIVMHLKWETTADNAPYSNMTASNGWEYLTDENGYLVDIFSHKLYTTDSTTGEIKYYLASEVSSLPSTLTSGNIKIISNGYDRTGGQTWAARVTNRTSTTMNDAQYYPSTYYVFSGSTFQFKVSPGALIGVTPSSSNGGLTYANQVVQISYEKDIYGSTSTYGTGGGDTAHRSDMRWTYATDDPVRVQTEALYVNATTLNVDNLPTLYSTNKLTLTASTGVATNSGKEVTAKLVENGSTQEYTSAIDSGYVAYSETTQFKMHAAGDAGGNYRFYAWYKYENGKFTLASNDTDFSVARDTTSTYVAAFVQADSNSLKFAHKYYTDNRATLAATYGTGIPAAKTNDGNTSITVSIYRNSVSDANLYKTYSATGNSVITIPSNILNIENNASYKVKVVMTASPNGTGTYNATYARTTAAGSTGNAGSITSTGVATISGYTAGGGTTASSPKTYTKTYALSDFYTGSGTSSSPYTMKAQNEYFFYSDFVEGTVTDYYKAATYDTSSYAESTTGGTVNYSSKTAKAGTSVTITATPEDGYYFVGWYTALNDGSVKTNEKDFTYDLVGNQTYYARFKALPTVSVTANVLLSTDGTSYSQNTISGPSLTVTDSSNSSNKATATTSAQSISVNTLNTASVTLSAAATSSQNYQLVGIYKLSDLTASGSSYTIGSAAKVSSPQTITGAVTYVALYKKIYTVTVKDQYGSGSSWTDFASTTSKIAATGYTSASTLYVPAGTSITISKGSHDGYTTGAAHLNSYSGTTISSAQTITANRNYVVLYTAKVKATVVYRVTSDGEYADASDVSGITVSGLAVSPTGLQDVSSTATFTANRTNESISGTNASHYEFKGWYDGSGNSLGTGTTSNTQTRAADRTFVAIYGPKNYTLTVNVLMTEDGTNYVQQSGLGVGIYAYKNGSETTFVSATTSAQNASVTYGDSITFSRNGSSSPATKGFYYASSLTAGTGANAGKYTIKNNATAISTSSPTGAISISGDTTVYLLVRKNYSSSVTVRIKSGSTYSNGSDQTWASVNPSGTYYAGDTGNVVFSADEQAGYTFLGWSASASPTGTPELGTADLSLSKTASYTRYAIYQLTGFTAEAGVSVYLADGTWSNSVTGISASVTPSSYTYSTDALEYSTSCTANGYVFKGWSTTEKPTSRDSLPANVTGLDRTQSQTKRWAIYEQLTYSAKVYVQIKKADGTYTTATENSQSGNTATVSPATGYVYGANITFTKGTVASGYIFRGWATSARSASATSVTTGDTFNVAGNGDVSAYAIFEAIVTDNFKVATKDLGDTSYSDSNTDGGTFKFSDKGTNVTINSTSAITSGNAKGPNGEKVTATATAASHYTFKGWYTNLDGAASHRVGQAAAYEDTIGATGVTYYALFDQDSYTDTYKAVYKHGTTYTEGTTGGTVDEEASVTRSGAYDSTPSNVVAAAANGYTFKGWFTAKDTSGTVQSSSTSWAHTITTGTTYYAIFERNTYNVRAKVLLWSSGSNYTATGVSTSVGTVKLPDVSAGISVNDTTVYYGDNTSITVSQANTAKYSFEGVYKVNSNGSDVTTYTKAAGDQVTGYASQTATGSATYVALFKIKTVTDNFKVVTKNVGDSYKETNTNGGTIDLSSAATGVTRGGNSKARTASGNYDLTVTATASKANGYTFKGWYNDAAGASKIQDGAAYNDTLTGKTVYALFEQNAYTPNVYVQIRKPGTQGYYTAVAGTESGTNLVATSNSNSASVPKATKTYGQTVTFTKTAENTADYKFLGWSASASPSDITALDSNAAKELTAGTDTLTLYAIFQELVTGSVKISHDLKSDAQGTGLSTTHVKVEVVKGNSASSDVVHTYAESDSEITVDKTYIRNDSTYYLRVTLRTALNEDDEYVDLYKDTKKDTTTVTALANTNLSAANKTTLTGASGYVYEYIKISDLFSATAQTVNKYEYFSAVNQFRERVGDGNLDVFIVATKDKDGSYDTDNTNGGTIKISANDWNTAASGQTTIYQQGYIGDDIVVSHDSTNTGYTFKGWYDALDDSSSHAVSFSGTGAKKVAGGQVFYALFEQDVYEANVVVVYNYDGDITKTLTTDTNGTAVGVNAAVDASTYTYSTGNVKATVTDKASRTADQKARYTFVGWYDASKTAISDSSESGGANQTKTTNRTFYALYKKLVKVTAVVANDDATSGTFVQEASGSTSGNKVGINNGTKAAVSTSAYVEKNSTYTVQGEAGSTYNRAPSPNNSVYTAANGGSAAVLTASADNQTVYIRFTKKTAGLTIHIMTSTSELSGYSENDETDNAINYNSNSYTSQVSFTLSNGTSFSLTATAADNYTFKGFNTTSSSTIADNLPETHSGTMGDTPIDVYAYFYRNPVTVKLEVKVDENLDGTFDDEFAGTTGDLSAYILGSSNEAVIAADSKTGTWTSTSVEYNTATTSDGVGYTNNATNLYRFAGWVYGGTTYTSNSDLRNALKNFTDDSTTVVARFERIPVTVYIQSYADNDGSGYTLNKNDGLANTTKATVKGTAKTASGKNITSVTKVPMGATISAIGMTEASGYDFKKFSLNGTDSTSESPSNVTLSTTNTTNTSGEYTYTITGYFKKQAEVKVVIVTDENGDNKYENSTNAYSNAATVKVDGTAAATHSAVDVGLNITELKVTAITTGYDFEGFDNGTYSPTAVKDSFNLGKGTSNTVTLTDTVPSAGKTYYAYFKRQQVTVTVHALYGDDIDTADDKTINTTTFKAADIDKTVKFTVDSTGYVSNSFAYNASKGITLTADDSDTSYKFNGWYTKSGSTYSSATITGLKLDNNYEFYAWYSEQGKGSLTIQHLEYDAYGKGSGTRTFTWRTYLTSDSTKTTVDSGSGSNPSASLITADSNKTIEITFKVKPDTHNVYKGYSTEDDPGLLTDTNVSADADGYYNITVTQVIADLFTNSGGTVTQTTDTIVRYSYIVVQHKTDTEIRITQDGSYDGTTVEGTTGKTISFASPSDYTSGTYRDYSDTGDYFFAKMTGTLNAGYTFKGWYIDDTLQEEGGTAVGIDDMVYTDNASDHLIVALFQPYVTATLTIQTNENDGNGYQTVTGDTGNTASINDTDVTVTETKSPIYLTTGNVTLDLDEATGISADYDFDGFYKSTALTTRLDSASNHEVTQSITANTTYYARFTRKQVTAAVAIRYTDLDGANTFTTTQATETATGGTGTESVSVNGAALSTINKDSTSPYDDDFDFVATNGSTSDYEFYGWYTLSGSTYTKSKGTLTFSENPTQNYTYYAIYVPKGSVSFTVTHNLLTSSGAPTGATKTNAKLGFGSTSVSLQIADDAAGTNASATGTGNGTTSATASDVIKPSNSSKYIIVTLTATPTDPDERNATYEYNSSAYQTAETGGTTNSSTYVWTKTYAYQISDLLASGAVLSHDYYTDFTPYVVAEVAVKYAPYITAQSNQWKDTGAEAVTGLHSGSETATISTQKLEITGDMSDKNAGNWFEFITNGTQSKSNSDFMFAKWYYTSKTSASPEYYTENTMDETRTQIQIRAKFTKGTPDNADSNGNHDVKIQNAAGTGYNATTQTSKEVSSRYYKAVALYVPRLDEKLRVAYANQLVDTSTVTSDTAFTSKFTMDTFDDDNDLTADTTGATVKFTSPTAYANKRVLTDVPASNTGKLAFTEIADSTKLYRFAGWYDNTAHSVIFNGTDVDTRTSIEITRNTSIDLIALYIPEVEAEVKVQYLAAGASAWADDDFTSGSNVTATKGFKAYFNADPYPTAVHEDFYAATNYSLKAETVTGYDFIGWYLDGTRFSTSAEATHAHDGSYTFVARFAEKVNADITIEYQAQGSSTWTAEASYDGDVTGHETQTKAYFTAPEGFEVTRSVADVPVSLTDNYGLKAEPDSDDPDEAKYSFAGWFIKDGSDYTAVSSDAVATHLLDNGYHFVARFTENAPKTYTIFYHYPSRYKGEQVFYKKTGDFPSGVTAVTEAFAILVMPEESIFGKDLTWGSFAVREGSNGTVADYYATATTKKVSLTYPSIFKADGSCEYVTDTDVEYNTIYKLPDHTYVTAPVNVADDLYFDHWNVVSTKTNRTVSVCYAQNFNYVVSDNFKIVPVFVPKDQVHYINQVTDSKSEVHFYGLTREQWSTSEDAEKNYADTDKIYLDFLLSYEYKGHEIKPYTGSELTQVGVVIEQVAEVDEAVASADGFSENLSTNYAASEADLSEMRSAVNTGGGNNTTTVSGHKLLFNRNLKAKLDNKNMYHYYASFNNISFKDENPSNPNKATSRSAYSVLRVYSYMIINGSVVLSEPSYVSMYDIAKKMS